jgi:hypothetical protein
MPREGGSTVGDTNHKETGAAAEAHLEHLAESGQLFSIEEIAASTTSTPQETTS